MKNIRFVYACTGEIYYIFYERINLRYADLEKYSCVYVFIFFNFFTNPLSHIDKFSVRSVSYACINLENSNMPHLVPLKTLQLQ